MNRLQDVARRGRARFARVVWCAGAPLSVLLAIGGTARVTPSKPPSPAAAASPSSATNSITPAAVAIPATNAIGTVGRLAPTNLVANTGTATNLPPRIDNATRGMRQWMSSSNVSFQAEAIEDTADAIKAKDQQFQHQFELGMRLRQQKEYELAVKTLLGVLESADAPQEIRRSALLELALTAQEQQQYAKAQQILAQYVRKFPEDANVPEILMRQGQLYRQMGASTLALAKFYAVMTVVLHLKLDNFDYYRRLVLQTQTEIADTYYLAGKHAEAADFFARLLKNDSKELNRSEIHYKLIQCHNVLAHHETVIAEAQQFVQRYPADPKLPEVRFALADSYRQLGRRAEATRQIQELLREQHAGAKQNPERWLHWRLRAGNVLANELFRDGDYVNALDLYLNLAQLNNAVDWQIPNLYQTALIYEKLNHPDRAIETYNRIASRETDLGKNPRLGLKTIVEMAKWRADHLAWRAKGEQAMQTLRPALQPQTATP